VRGKRFCIDFGIETAVQLATDMLLKRLEER